MTKPLAVLKLGAVMIESGIAFTDVTTGNASISKHGLAPKLSGNMQDAYRGDGSQGPQNGGRNGLFFATDFLSYADDVWVGTAIGAGSGQSGYFRTAAAANWGWRTLKAGTENGAGFMVTTASYPMLFGGGEFAEFIFALESATGTTVYMGYHNALTATAPTNGAWLNLAGTTLSGKCANASGTATTGTTYTISADTVYHGKIVVNVDATRVDFYLYDNLSALLWTNNVTTDIPTATNRVFGHGVVMTSTQTDAAEKFSVDYMSMGVDRTLQR